MTINGGGAVLLAALAGTLWGSSGMVIRYLGDYGLTAVEISALRLVVSALALSVYLLLRDRRRLCIPLKQLPGILVMGFGCLFFFSVSYALAVTRISLSLTVVLIYTSPMMVMLLSVRLFHETLTVSKVAAMLLIFLGCCLVAGLFSAAIHYSWIGISFALLAAMLYALYAVLAKVQTRSIPPITLMTWTFILGAAGGVMMINVPHCLGTLYAAPKALAWVIVAGLLNSALPYLLYTCALARIEAGKAAVTASVEPLVATLLGVVLFHEDLTLSALGGMSLILSGIFVMNIRGFVKQSLPPGPLLP